MLDLLIKNAHVITVDKDHRVFPQGYVAVQGKNITAVGSMAQLDTAGAKRTVDAAGKVVFPGLVNTHNHMFQTLLKGLGTDRSLFSWYQNMTAPAATNLDEQSVYDAAMLACVESMRGGATTVLDYMYAHPAPHLSDAVIQAFLDSGLRGILGRGMNTVKDYDAPPKLVEDEDVALADCERLIQKWHGHGEGRIGVAIAPSCVSMNTEALFNGARELSRRYGTGITIHACESPADGLASQEIHGMRELEVLEKTGLLGEKLMLVHAVCLNEREIRQAMLNGIKISHNPVSNMYLADGVAPVPQMLERGICVGLGTDGPASNNTQDLMEVMKFTALLHKSHSGDPTVITAERVVEMATIDGARAVWMEDAIGSIEEGKRADLMIFDPMRSPRSVPMHDPVATLVYSASGTGIDTLVIDGAIVMEDGAFPHLDEEDIKRRAAAAARRLVEKGHIHAVPDRWRSFSY